VATYKITSPDGGVYQITAPDSATQDQVLAYVQQNFQSKAPPPEESSTLGAAGRGAVRGAVPFMAGVAGGAATGAALGSVVPGVGTLVGGVVGGLGAGFGASKLQEKIFENYPHLAEMLGQAPAQQEADIRQHPYASMAGEMAPGLLAFRPSLSALRTPAGRAVAAINAGVGAGLETGQEAIGDQPMDPAKIALATLGGALMNKETRVGNKLMNLGTLGRHGPFEPLTPEFPRQPTEITREKTTEPIGKPVGVGVQDLTSSLAEPGKPISEYAAKLKTPTIESVPKGEIPKQEPVNLGNPPVGVKPPVDVSITPRIEAPATAAETPPVHPQLTPGETVMSEPAPNAAAAGPAFSSEVKPDEIRVSGAGQDVFNQPDIGGTGERIPVPVQSRDPQTSLSSVPERTGVGGISGDVDAAYAGKTGSPVALDINKEKAVAPDSDDIKEIALKKGLRIIVKSLNASVDSMVKEGKLTPEEAANISSRLVADFHRDPFPQTIKETIKTARTELADIAKETKKPEVEKPVEPEVAAYLARQPKPVSEPTVRRRGQKVEEPDEEDEGRAAKAIIPRPQVIKASVGDIQNSLYDSFGVHSKRLLDSGIVKIVQSVGDLPENVLKSGATPDVMGYFYKNRAWLVADNINPKDAKGILLHEIGVHAGMKKMLGEELFYKVLDHVSNMADKGIEPFAKARAEVPKDTDSRYENEETLAYLIDSHPELPLVQRIISQIRTWLYQVSNGHLVNLTADDLRTLAVNTLKAVSRTKTAQTVRTPEEAFKFAKRGKEETDPVKAANETEKNYSLGGNKEPPSNVIQKLAEPPKPGSFDTFVRNWQSTTRPLKTLQRQMQLTGKLIYGHNDTYYAASTAVAKAQVTNESEVLPLVSRLQTALINYAKAAGISTQEAVGRLNARKLAVHELERRTEKWLETVPLSEKLMQTPSGKVMSPAGQRDAIMDYLAANPHLDDPTVAGLKAQLQQLATNHTDLEGYSRNTSKPKSLDINDKAYHVIGEHSPEELNELRDRWNKDPNQAELKEFNDSLRALQDKTIDLDKKAGYWAPQVDNFKRFYDYKDYVPFKGIPNADREFGLNSKRLSGELSEEAHKAEGRNTDSDRVITQSMADAAKAAARYGRKDVQDTLYNLIKDINDKSYGTVSEQPIQFADRYKNPDLEMANRKNKILRYRPDGSVDVITINKPELLEALKREIQNRSTAQNLLNSFTNLMAKGHTRYNLAFHPYNFVRHILTNSLASGAEFGPAATAKFLGSVAADVSTGGFYKTAKAVNLVRQGNMDQLAEMAKNAGPGSHYQDLYDYLRMGGRTTWMDNLSNKGQEENLMKKIGPKKIFSKDTLKLYLDNYADMFEMTNRLAAYRTAKQNAISSGMPEEQAIRAATGFAKDLLNFEQTGKYGRNAGMLFEFFRANATGAVRAIDAALPAFMDADTYIKRLPAGLNTPENIATLKANYGKIQTNARIMMASVLGAGMFLYEAALAAADTDDQGRNKVATDDMSMWARNMRMPTTFMGDAKKYLGKDNDFIQMPWGFGLGALGSFGASIAAFSHGNASLKDLLGNIIVAGKDSFFPIPVGNFNPGNNPAAFLVDSVVPSFARPLVEFAMNEDTFGREIYNNRQTKYGSAYTGGEYVPEIYKDAARLMVQVTNGQWDVEPNTLHFFASNYLDGLMRATQNIGSDALDLAGKKDFDAKTDLWLLDNFVGKHASVDAREFADAEKDIKKMQGVMNMFQNRPEYLSRYLDSNPNAPMLVAMYDQLVNGPIKQVRTVMGQLESGDLPPNERRPMYDEYKLMRDYYMKEVVEMYKDLR
jgi:Large polyvalent protein associated domain 38